MKADLAIQHLALTRGNIEATLGLVEQVQQAMFAFEEGETLTQFISSAVDHLYAVSTQLRQQTDNLQHQLQPKELES